MARVFDLLGWFARCAENPSPEPLEVGHDTCSEDMAGRTAVHHHPIPRCYYDDKEKRSIQLHGFSDASNAAYGGVVYVRTIYQDTTVSVSLVISKTKVAPISPLGTTLGLELCGAQVLSKLLRIAMESLDVGLQDVFAWSDSMIILCWLHMPLV